MSTNSRPEARLLQSNAMALIEISLCDVVLPDRKLRRHPKSQIEQLKRSIQGFGWVSPILIDGKNSLIAGAARVAAAKELGLKSAPALRVEHLSEAEVRAYRIADNKLAEAAEWDEQLLALEFQDLEKMEIDLELTAFETPEIDCLLASESTPPDPLDAPTEIPSEENVVSRKGDLWLLGKHRLLCGDALNDGRYGALLEGKVADMVFTDPPYNVPVKGHIGGLGKVQHREVVMASGELSEEEF